MPCADCGKLMWRGGGSRPEGLARCRSCRTSSSTPWVRPVLGSDVAYCKPCKGPCLPRTCPECSKVYAPKWNHRPGQVWCSKSCAQSVRNRARYTRTPEQQREHRRTRDLAKSRRRRMAKASSWDGVTDAAILERDGWRCGICRRRISQEIKYPDPRSASIDHLVPLSQGGDDTAANKRAAHLGCNMARGAKGGGEQLALVG